MVVVVLLLRVGFGEAAVVWESSFCVCGGRGFLKRKGVSMVDGGDEGDENCSSLSLSPFF